jgi:hypothetical protein
LAWQYLIALDLKLPAEPESQMHIAAAIDKYNLRVLQQMAIARNQNNEAIEALSSFAVYIVLLCCKS